MDLSKEFVGSLYQGDQVTKDWTVISKGQAVLTVEQCERSNKWKLEAKRDQHKIWECWVESNFTHKIRDNFVQWSYTKGKERFTYGFRIKDQSQAQEFTAMLTFIASNPPSNEKRMTIILPSKQKASLTVKKSMTMAQVLKQVTSQHGLDNSQFALSAIIQPHSDLRPLKPQMTVNDLPSSDLVMVKRHKATTSESASTEKLAKDLPTTAPAKEEETTPVTITLPDGKDVRMDVVPSITLIDLQRMVCISSSLNPAAHKFDLLIANQDKIRLRQLKLSSLSLIRKEGIATSGGTESTDGGSLKTKIRIAPPPPPGSPNKRLTLNKPRPPPSPLSSPVTKRGVESTDGGRGRSRDDINDTVSRLLSEQAIGSSHSPSRDQTRRKLNPAPPPPRGVAKQPKREGPSVKRSAPPPPKASQSPSRGREEPDGGEHTKRRVPHHGGVALPCMTSKGKNKTSEEIRKQDPLGDIKTTPTLDRLTPPTSYSPGRKPMRKAPTKPPPHPPKTTADTPPQNDTPTFVRSLKGTITNSSDKKQQPVQQNIPSPGSGLGAFTFKFPPPPPRKAPVPAVQTREQEGREGEGIRGSGEYSEEGDSERDSDSSDSNDDSSSGHNGGYNIEAAIGGETSDSDNSTSSEENSSDDEEETSEADSYTGRPHSNTGRPHSNTSTEEERTKPSKPVHSSMCPAEPESSSDEEDAASEGIRLLSHQITDPSIIPLCEGGEQSDGGVAESGRGQEGHIIDDKIVSLRNLIADTCELGGKDQLKSQDSVASVGSDTDFDLTTIRQMGPPPDMTTPTNTPLSSAASHINSAPPTAPPPPPIDSSLPKKQAPPPALKPKPQPPVVKPKPHPQTTVEDELAQKLKRRQQLMDEPQPRPNTGHTPQEPPTHQLTGITTSGVGVTPGVGMTFGVGVASNPTGGGPDVQLQLQMLQQQMLQQQMMQLQQQFQQLQSMMITNPSPAAGLLLQQQMQQLQSMGVASGMGVAPGMVPQPMGIAPTMGVASGMGVAPEMGVTQSLGINPYSTAMGALPGQQQSLNPLVGNQPVMTPPATSLVPSPPPPEDQLAPPTGPAKGLSRRPSEADVRKKALGSATESFNDLMSQVRDIDPEDILKKPPETDANANEEGSAYTGMTAALVQAMKERRKSFQDPNYEFKVQSTDDWEET